MPQGESADPGRAGLLGRLLLDAALALTWAVSLPYMWRSVTTVPSAARLQQMQSQILHVPTPATFVRTAGQSFVELLVLLALLWPWWRRFWLLRLVAAFLALAVWAVATMPLELTILEQLHHRWLVGCDLLLLAAMIVTVAARFFAFVRQRRSEPA